MMSWFKITLRRWRERRRHEAILRQQGFLVFCECGVVLNDNNPATTTNDITYLYVCPCCGRRAEFDLTAPVPLRVHDRPVYQ